LIPQIMFLFPDSPLLQTNFFFLGLITPKNIWWIGEAYRHNKRLVRYFTPSYDPFIAHGGSVIISEKKIILYAGLYCNASQSKTPGNITFFRYTNDDREHNYELLMFCWPCISVQS
jgi:hypothetical protein